MRAEIISVGTELLLGQIVNTNAQYISQKLSECGIGVYYQTVVGDNAERLKTVFGVALKRADMIVFTGGLGPTLDDLTKEIVAEILELPLKKNIYWEEKLKEFFNKLNIKMVENNLKQALIPESAKLLPNKNGTAPGIIIEKNNKMIILLPGPPRELIPMFNNEVIPHIKDSSSGKILKSLILRVMGLSESAIDKMLEPLLKSQSNPTIALLAQAFEINVRLTVMAKNEEEADQLLNQYAEKIKKILYPYCYGINDTTLSKVIGNLLKEKQLTLSLAESCTGGLISNMITNVPGSSTYFSLGLIVYSKWAKRQWLKINPSILDNEGVVSEAVACEMAENVRKLSGADIGLSVTGLAGPTSDDGDKPIGLVYIGLANKEKTNCREFNFWGDRESIKKRAALTALNMLRMSLIK